MGYPPPETVKQWRVEWLKGKDGNPVAEDQYIAERAADWELEFCVEWLATIAMTKPWDTVAQLALELRAARRPEPLSLKEQALRALNEAVYMADDSPPEGISTDQADIIRRALEGLPDA